MELDNEEKNRMAMRAQWIITRIVFRPHVYAQYVEQAVRERLPASPWEQVHAQLVLGGKQFLDKVRKAVAGSAREQPQQRALKRRPRWEKVLQTVQELKQEKWAAFRDRHGDWGRDLALYLGRRECGLSLCELGKAAGGVDYAAVSAAIKRFERRLAREHSLGKIVETMRLEMLNVNVAIGDNGILSAC